MRYVTAISIIALAGWATFAGAKQVKPAPTQTVGIEVSVLDATSLEEFFADAEGRTFRTREIILQPGGTIAIHSHDERPGAVYVIEGEFVEHRSDMDEPVIRRKGDSFIEGYGLTHWSENVSEKPARVFAVDMAPAETP